MSADDRLKTLEDRVRLRELKYEYCYQLDNENIAEWADLFTSDATLDFGPIGRFEGREAIEDFGNEVIDEYFTFMRHFVHNPVLEIDGDEATGVWYLEGPMVTHDGTAQWSQGTETETYERVDGEWKFASIEGDFSYLVDYDEGWAHLFAE